MNATKFHVIAVETTEEGFGEKNFIGFAETKDEAAEMCEAAGYVVIKEGAGGTYDHRYCRWQNKNFSRSRVPQR